ncbi:hypothetical protein [Desulfovibrio sp. Huiquan2017]|uniref:hypothetical protein n=1 Tax=Desulfovibrio sp. Huiquan2017 TaxID=2816861 RepID=UPI001A923402|nr:hypothetical protein [Desulfovibrio sp. Huiquan2017]
MQAKKSTRRVSILESIFDVLTDHEVYETINYRNLDESRIKQYLHQPLQRMTINVLQEHGGCQPDRAKTVARQALRWEGDQQTTVNNFMFFGVQHRPDFDLNILNTSFAIEIKRGQGGTDIRSGIGQSLVYTTLYDFCAYLFIDTSADKRVVNAFSSEREQAFVEKLWRDHNVMFKVV